MPSTVSPLCACTVGLQYAETPLFFAARRSHAKVVQLLLQRGAKHELTSRFGDTAKDETTDRGTLQAFETGESGHLQRR